MFGSRWPRPIWGRTDVAVPENAPLIGGTNPVHYKSLRDELNLIADQRNEAWDLLRRIRASMEDGSFEVPDVWHAVEAEIADILSVNAASGRQQ